MEQKQISHEEIYNRLLNIERALALKGIFVADEEGELTEEFKKILEKRRHSKNYMSHEEVKKRILSSR